MLAQALSWILTSTLTVIFMITVSFVLFTTEKLAPRKSLKPQTVIAPTSNDASKIDITRIYKNDLFNTYKEVATQPVIEEKTNPLPPPPVPQKAPIIQAAVPQFLAPLPLSLKGIISSSEEQFNRAIVANNKTKEESLFKVGDKIEDAEIIRINSNKVIFVRSNGQQEILFTSQTDAQEDPLFLHDKTWSPLVKKIGENSYLVDSDAFADRIVSLAQFIDMLDVTTAFRGNRSNGCRIGVIAPESLGVALGFISGDVVTSINDIPTRDTKDRVAIYNAIKKLPLGGIITVKLLRNHQEMTLVFSLKTIERRDEQLSGSPEPTVVVRDEKNQALASTVATQSAAQFEPAVKNLQNSDKQAMLNNGGRAALLQRAP